MPIIDVTESWEARTVKETFNEKTTLRVFTVTFDDTPSEAIARPLIALRHPEIPPYGKQHPYDRNMSVVDRLVKPSEGPLVYEVTCSYSTINRAGGEKEENPLKQKPEISWTFVTSDEQIDMALARVEPGSRKENVPIATTSGESFDPPISDEMHDLVLRFVRNEKAFDSQKVSRYKGAVNSDTFLGYAPYHAKLAVWDGDKIYDERWGDYWHVTYEIQFRVYVIKGKKYGWQKRIFNKGLYEIKAGKLEKIVINEQEITEPWPIDENGKAYTEQEVLSLNKCMVLVFETRTKLPFSILNIKV